MLNLLGKYWWSIHKRPAHGNARRSTTRALFCTNRGSQGSPRDRTLGAASVPPAGALAYAEFGGNTIVPLLRGEKMGADAYAITVV